MDQSISNQFRSALTYLLAQEGRGAQTRLASQKKIDRGYLNAIVKGRKSGSEKIRSKIANHFNMAYEEMFILGRRILEGESEHDLNNRSGIGPLTNEDSSLFLTVNETTSFNRSGRTEKISLDVSDKILKVMQILKSSEGHGDYLGGVIDTFHEAISVKEENLALKSRLKGLETRISNLEKKLGDDKNLIEKSA